MFVLHREGGGPWWSLEYTFMVSLGQGGSWIGRKFLVNLRNVCIPQRWWWTLVDLGYTFMVSLGQGESWKEILGEPVKWLYSTGMVVDLGGPWIYLYDFLGPGWTLEGNSW